MFQVYQIKLVCTQRYCISCVKLPKKILSFYPNVPIFSHGFIRYIRDILQLNYLIEDRTGLHTICAKIDWAHTIPNQFRLVATLFLLIYNLKFYI